jgi:hypothetical protein
VLLAPLVSAAACGDDAEDSTVDVCRVGYSLMIEMFSTLDRDAPSCQSDADCTLVSDTVECGGSRVSGCGRVIHRAQIDAYQAAQDELQDRFCAAVSGLKYGCVASPSCIASRVACEAGRCTSKQATP